MGLDSVSEGRYGSGRRCTLRTRDNRIGSTCGLGDARCRSGLNTCQVRRDRHACDDRTSRGCALRPDERRAGPSGRSYCTHSSCYLRADENYGSIRGSTCRSDRTHS